MGRREGSGQTCILSLSSVPFGGKRGEDFMKRCSWNDMTPGPTSVGSTGPVTVMIIAGEDSVSPPSPCITKPLPVFKFALPLSSLTSDGSLLFVRMRLAGLPVCELQISWEGGWEGVSNREERRGGTRGREHPRSGILHSSKLENPMHVASFLNRGQAGGAERQGERGRERVERVGALSTLICAAGMHRKHRQTLQSVRTTRASTRRSPPAG